MAYKLQLKRGASGSLPTGSAGEPLFTTDTNDLYIGTGASNQRYQKYIASGTSSQFLKGDGSLDSNTYYLASNPSAYIALTALTASAPLSYNNTTGAFTIAQASGSVNGFLSSTDWTTFNNKQNTITNPVTGTGTTNYLPKWTSGSAIGNSIVQDNGSAVGIGVSSFIGGYKLEVSGLQRNFGANNELRFGEFDANYNYFQGINLAGTVSRGFIFFGTGEYMRITPSSNLLVGGTTDNGNRLQVTGNGYFDGNVGVGTAGPYFAKLQINASGAGFQDALILENTNSAAANLGTALTFAGVGSVAQTVIRSAWDGAATTDAYMSFLTKGSGSVTERMRLTSSGNLGLGVTPSAWSSLWSAEQFGQAGSLFAYKSGSNYTVISNNSYAVGGAFQTGDARYINNGFSTAYAQNNSGEHLWLTAPSGTAGGTITHTLAMTLTANGRLLLGTTTEGTNLLDVNGTGRFSGALQLNSSTYATLDMYGANGYGNQIRFGDGTTLKAAIRQNYNVGEGLEFYSGGLVLANLALYINTSGNISIGNTNNTYKLDVSGTFNATGAATFSSSVTAQGVNVGANPLGTDRMLQVSGTAFTSGTTQYGIVNNPTMTTPTSIYGYYGSILVTSATHAYGVYIDGSNGTITNKWGIYQAGASDKNYFAANVLIGTTTDSGDKLQVNGSAKVSGKLIVNHSSTDYIAEFLNTSSANPYGVIIKDAASAANNYPLFHIVNNAASVEYFRVNSGTGTAVFSSTIQTGTPTGGTARPWKLGQYNATAPSATGYVEVEINGVLYKLIAAT